MKLYLLERPEGREAGYDQYESAVVAAMSSLSARNTHPSGSNGNWYSTWISPEAIKVTYLGTAAANRRKPGVICASFRAG